MTLTNPYFANWSFLGVMKGHFLSSLVFLLIIAFPESSFASDSVGQGGRIATASFPKPSDKKPIPFQFAKGSIVFKVNVNGHEGWALLDSGAGSSGIDLSFAREAGLVLGSPMTPMLPGVGPAVKTLARYRIDGSTRIMFPGQMTTNAPVFAYDMHPVSAVLGKPIIMVVGADFLSHLAVQVDLRQNLLQLAPSGALFLADRQSFVELTDPHRRLNVKIGERVFGLAIDLGFNGWVNLNTDLWERIEKSGGVRTGRARNASGEVFTRRIAHIYRIDAGKFPAWNVEVGSAALEAGKMDGYVGMGFMRKFDAFILDLKDRKLWLQPRVEQ